MATIKKGYVSFETAKLLKKRGFNEECEYFYDEYDNNEYVICSNGGSAYNDDRYPTYYSMPTIKMVNEWLRKAHNLFIKIIVGEREDKTWYDYDIFLVNRKNRKFIHYKRLNVLHPSIEYNTPEEAAEIAIKYCLEHLI